MPSTVSYLSWCWQDRSQGMNKVDRKFSARIPPARIPSARIPSASAPEDKEDTQLHWATSFNSSLLLMPLLKKPAYPAYIWCQFRLCSAAAVPCRLVVAVPVQSLLALGALWVHWGLPWRPFDSYNPDNLVLQIVFCLWKILRGCEIKKTIDCIGIFLLLSFMGLVWPSETTFIYKDLCEDKI